MEGFYHNYHEPRYLAKDYLQLAKKYLKQSATLAME